MSKRKIKTNRYYFDIDWDIFFQRYKMFLIKVTCKSEMHRSVYDLLSAIPSGGCPVSVSYGATMDKGLKIEFYLMAPSDSNISERRIKETLKNSDFIDCEVEEFSNGDKMPKSEKVANLLLSNLPNCDDNICYADGKLFIGRCLDWDKNYARYGELSFLRVYFSYGGMGMLNLNCYAVTFTEESKFKRAKYYRSQNLAKIAKERPFYINYTSGQIYATRLGDKETQAFYKGKVHERQNDNNHIPFLDFKDEGTLASCQATTVITVIDAMHKVYGDFISIERIDYDAEYYEPKSGSTNTNKIEAEYMQNFLDSTGLAVIVFDPKSQECSDTATATLRALEDLGHHITEEISDKTAVFRILPSFIKEKMALSDKSAEKKTEVKKSQCADKHRYHSLLVPVQDLTPDKIKLSDKPGTIKTNKETIKNLLRQLCVKKYVLTKSLPAIISDRYKGATVIYGENISKTPYYEVVKATIDESGVVTYSYDKCNSSGGYILFDGIKVQTKRLVGNMSMSSLFWLKIGDLEIQIFDGDEFVFPNTDYIADHLNKGFKTSKLKNKGVRDDAFGAFIGLHYWQDDNCDWCYSAGQRQAAMHGTTTKYGNKTHIRHIRTNRPMTRQEMEDYIVSKLEEGWMRTNNNSVHPSVYKFLHEALEIYKTRQIANS